MGMLKVKGKGAFIEKTMLTITSPKENPPEQSNGVVNVLSSTYGDKIDLDAVPNVPRASAHQAVLC